MSMEECTLEVWLDRMLDTCVVFHWIDGRRLPYSFEDDDGATHLTPAIEQ